MVELVKSHLVEQKSFRVEVLIVALILIEVSIMNSFHTGCKARSITTQKMFQVIFEVLRVFVRPWFEKND